MKADPTTVAIIGSILIALAGGLIQGAAFWITAVVILVAELAIVAASKRT